MGGGYIQNDRLQISNVLFSIPRGTKGSIMYHFKLLNQALYKSSTC